MRTQRAMSEGQWQVMVQQRNELGQWIAKMRIEMDTSSRASSLQERFEDLTREYHEIELLMAY